MHSDSKRSAPEKEESESKSRKQRWDSRADLHALEQFIDFLVRHLLPQLREHVSKLACTYEPVALLIEHLEAADEFLCGNGGGRVIGASVAGNGRRRKAPELGPGGLPGVPAGLNPSGRLSMFKNVV